LECEGLPGGGLFVRVQIKGRIKIWSNL